MLDNAKNNTKMMEELETLFISATLTLTPRNNIFIVFPTWSISAQVTLSRPSHQTPLIWSHWTTTYPQHHNWLKTLLHTILLSWLVQPSCHLLIHHLSRSLSKNHHWRKSRWPMGSQTTLKQLQLLQDVPTWWDSVYYMINHFRYLHLVNYCANLLLPSLTCTT